MRNHQPGQTQPSQHEIVRLATQAYESHDGGTDEGLIAFLLADIVEQQEYLDWRKETNRGRLRYNATVQKRMAMEAALIERLRQLS